ncbi:MAG TPA: 2-oxo acid dehydrogenase subunit E2 [Ktedonobacteraceae bacterium]|nr:2-oxo acid dehydrogenase subunit E2 [Ktedonobacteraceae bacterium]
MKQSNADYQVVQSKGRRAMAFAMRSVQRKPMIHGLIEVDVTRARAFLRDHKAKTGESLSFTAFIATCLGKAVDEHKSVQACPKGSKHLVLFDEVDVSTMIERDVAGQKQATIYIIRAANKKTFREIHQEIRIAQVEEVAKALTPATGKNWVLFLPTFLIRFFFWAFWRICRTYPQVQKKVLGTVGLTAVGMFGEGAGWGIPPGTPQTLYITVGGIGVKQGVVDGHIAIREYLSLTISFDHEMIDGAPAAHFTERLKDLIESGYGLDDSTVESEQAAVSVAPGTSKKS